MKTCHIIIVIPGVKTMLPHTVNDHQRMVLILLVSCPQLLSQSADVSRLYSMYPMYPMNPKVGHLQGLD